MNLVGLSKEGNHLVKGVAGMGVEKAFFWFEGLTSLGNLGPKVVKMHFHLQQVP